MFEIGRCAIWGTPAQVVVGGGGRWVRSARAGGDYRISSTAETELEAFTPSDRAKLTTWLVDQRRFGEERPFITSYTLPLVRAARPLNYSEKKRRLFMFLIAHEVSPDSSILFSNDSTGEGGSYSSSIGAWIESKTQAETTAFVRLMIQEGLLREELHEVGHLTPRGWQFIEEIQTGGAPTDQAFVAMWFDEAMDAAYSEGIAPAIEAAGYEPFRVDRKETINKIDDEIVAEIRRSRFVVADFTCPLIQVGKESRAEARGGVYFEAGFAQGLGTDVIWTVRRDCIAHVHFDTRQFSHILWDEPQDLKLALERRIGAVIGDGPHKPAG